MGLFDHFPYTNFHSLNLNWIVEKVQEVLGRQTQTEEDFTALHTYVEDYFNNLDYEAEIDEYLDAMITSGQFASVINPIVSGGAVPIFVASTSAMTDPNKLYVLESDGHVYQNLSGTFQDTGVIYSGTPSNYVSNLGTAPANSDADDVNMNSIYFNGSSGGAFRMTNTPLYNGVQYIGWLVTYLNGTSTGLIKQIYYPYSQVNPVQMRTLTNNGWTDWKALLYDVQVPLWKQVLYSEDPDSLTSPGLYLINSNNTIPEAKLPSMEPGAAFLFVWNFGNFTLQIIYQFDTGALYVRNYNGSNWTNWHNNSLGRDWTKAAMFGDSITLGRDGAGSGNVAVPMPRWAARELGWRIDNFGVGSQGWLTTQYISETAIDNIQAHNLTGYSTAIFMYGCNDSDQALGSYTDTTQNTIMGAMYRAIKWVAETYPTVNIIICGPLNSTIHNGTFPLWGWDAQREASADHWTLGDMDEEYAKFCKRYSINYISWRNSPLNAWNINTLLGDGVHPTQQGYKILARWFAGQLLARSC